MARRKAATSRGLLVDEVVTVPSGPSGQTYQDAAEIAADPPPPAEAFEPWFQIEMGGHPVRFGFVSAAEILRLQNGEPTHAVTWAESGVVVLDHALKKNPALLATVFIHELVHVGFGANYSSEGVVDAVLRAPIAKREEAIASYLSHQLAGALIAGGLLKLPPLPRPRRGRK